MFSSAYVWAKILGYMEEQLGSVIVSTWFDDAEVVELNEEQLIIHASSDYRRDIIRQRYQSYIKEALQEIFNSDAKLVVFSDEDYEALPSLVALAFLRRGSAVSFTRNETCREGERNTIAKKKLDKKTFICPHCEKAFSPTLLGAMGACMNFDDESVLVKCTNCGKKERMIPTIIR